VSKGFCDGLDLLELKTFVYTYTSDEKADDKEKIIHFAGTFIQI
jgi:hypothetical protein